MNRLNHVAFTNRAAANRANVNVTPPYQKGLRNNAAQQDYRESMLHTPVKPAIKSSNQPPNTANGPPIKRPAHKRTASTAAGMWKSTFKPAGERSPQDINSQDRSTSGSEKVELYDPYDPGSSESEPEMGREGPVHYGSEPEMGREGPVHYGSEPEMGQEGPVHYGYEHTSPGRGHRDNHRWESSYCEPGNRLLEGRRGFCPETRPTECQGLELAGYSPINRPRDHRGFSPDDSSTQLMSTRFPVSYGGQKTNGEERMTIPEYRREMTTAVRLSPPMLHMDPQHHSGYVEAGVDQITPSIEVKRNRTSSPIRDVEKSPCTCELCEVEFAKMQELEIHLESKRHWDTLEHIQQHNNYDDLVIAFLQEVMLFKVRQCSRLMGESAREALREDDHMTMVEMFHCAACQVYVSKSASSVENHRSSQEHLCKKKVFGMWQRRACLLKAETMMKELKPQFEQFLEGAAPFD